MTEKAPTPDGFRCIQCGTPILVMIFRGEHFCSDNCAKKGGYKS